MPHTDSNNRTLVRWPHILATTIVYMATARLSLLLAFEGGIASPVWPPSGIAFAAVLIWGRAVWPGILIGTFGATILASLDGPAQSNMLMFLTGSGIGIGNTLEALTGAFLFHRIIGPSATLDRTRHAFGFAGIAVVMCLVASTIGPTSACLIGTGQWDTFGTTWFTWWLGDVGGVLTVTPLFFRRRATDSTRSGISIAETGALIAMLVTICLFVFSGLFSCNLVGFVAYLIVPILLWIVFRSSPRYTAIAVACVAGAAIYGTTRGHGPFVADTLNMSLLLVQGFTCTLSVTLLIVASTLSERRRADAALHNVQRRQDLILHTVPMALYTANPKQYGTTWISARIESICGFSADEYTSTPELWASRIHPEDKAKTIEAYEAVLAGASRQMEYRWKCANGEYRWFLDHPMLVFDSNGKPTEIVGAWLDITDKKTTDIALRASESRIAAILDHSPAIISLKDADGRYLLANKKLSELTGVSPSDILGKTDADLFPKEFAEAFGKSDQTVQRHGGTVETEQTIPHQNELRTFLTLKFPIHDETSRSPIICAIATDITDRSRAEESLATQGRKLSALAEELSTLLAHTRDFVYRHNADGFFEYASPSVQQITGFSPEKWNDHYTQCLTDNPLNQAVIGSTQKALSTGKDQPPYLVEIYHKLGHRITLELNERCYFEHGKVAGIIGVARDVTQRIRAEQDLVHARDAADAASRAKGVFLANLSHELRTPIMAIMGATELAANAAGEAMSIDACRDIALRNGQHLLALINDLLDVAQMESGVIDIVRRHCSLTDIIANVHAATASLPYASNIELRFSYDSDIPEMIETDPTRLTQAIINLVGNALKFTHRGHAHVSIAVHRNQPDPRLTIRVEDTGEGIPKDAHERIFENFAQVDQQRQGVVDGVGLGLPLAKAISEQLGGHLRVKSQVGKGSVFTLAVATGDLTSAVWIKPHSVTRQNAASQTTPLPTMHLCATILLAEDFCDTRELLRIALETAGASVVAVSNGQEAVNAATMQQFDLIILDIRMPVMDGREAVRRLRQNGCLVPTIALTASTMAAEYDNLVADGFDDVWSKPLTIADLMAKIASYAHSVPETPLRSVEPSAATQDKLAQVRASYIEALPKRVAAMRSAAERSDRTELHEQLHQITGAAGMHDLPDISREAARLLKRAKAGTLDGHPQELDHLAELADSVHRSA